GVGQTVTALYELVPTGRESATSTSLKYQTGRTLTEAAADGELFTVHVRFKRPGNTKGEELAVAAYPGYGSLAETPDDFRFATALAGFGMMLRNSEHKGDLTWRATAALAASAAGENPRRQELVALVTKAAELSGGDKTPSTIAK